MTTRPYRVAPFLSQACRVLGLSQARVVMRAGLSADFLAHEGRGLGAKDWFGVLAALMAEAEGADGPVELGRAMAAGPLHPALMAFSASPDIATGIRRLATFKPPIAPIALEVSQRGGQFQIDIRASDGVAHISPQIAAMEVAYFIELFRLFAAEEIIPVEITLPTDAEPGMTATDFAGRSFDFRHDPQLVEYQPVIDRFLSVLGGPDMAAAASAPSVAAEVIWTAATDGTDQLRYTSGAATDGTDQLRYTSGADAAGLMAARTAQSDEAFLSGIKAQFGLN